MFEIEFKIKIIWKNIQELMRDDIFNCRPFLVDPRILSRCFPQTRFSAKNDRANSVSTYRFFCLSQFPGGIIDTSTCWFQARVHSQSLMTMDRIRHIFLLLLLGVLAVSHAEDNQARKRNRMVSIFNIVKFKNDPCEANDDKVIFSD